MAEEDFTSPEYWEPIIRNLTGDAAWDVAYAHALQLLRDDPERALPDFHQMKTIVLNDNDGDDDGGENIVNVFKRSLRTDVLTVTWALCVVDGDEGELMKEQNKGDHAERNLLSNLRTPSFSRLEIYLSTSPCQYCCKYIIDFYKKKRNENPDLTIDIICSSLYMLPSLEERRGLSNLCNTPGIEVRTFTKRDWSTLRKWEENGWLNTEQ